MYLPVPLLIGPTKQGWHPDRMDGHGWAIALGHDPGFNPYQLRLF
jgi:hypothetical protein